MTIDTKEFHALLNWYDDEASYGSLNEARSKLIAHIDAKLAAPTPTAASMEALPPQPVGEQAKARARAEYEAWELAEAARRKGEPLGVNEIAYVLKRWPEDRDTYNYCPHHWPAFKAGFLAAVSTRASSATGDLKAEAAKLAPILRGVCEGGGEERHIDIYADDYQPGDGDVFVTRAADLLDEIAASPTATPASAQPVEAAPNIEEERKLFEEQLPKGWSREMKEDEDSDIVYVDDLTAGAFNGWLMARAAAPAAPVAQAEANAVWLLIREGAWPWEQRIEAAETFLRSYADTNMEVLLDGYHVQPIIRKLAASILGWQQAVLAHAPEGVCGVDSAPATTAPVAPQGAQGEPVAWLEAEPRARGQDPRNVAWSMIYSSRIHTKCAPMTSNPVWPLYAGPLIGQQAEAPSQASQQGAKIGGAS